MAHTSDDHAASLSFGPFRLIRTGRRLSRASGEEVTLGGRAFDILWLLVTRAGEVVSQRELVASVWTGVFVDDSNLRVHIANLRKALGDGVDGARYIETVPGRGYAFIAAVER